MARHTSLDPAERAGSASDTNGRWVPIAGRTGSNYTWTLTADVSDVDSGTVDVKWEAAPRKNDDDVVTIATVSQFATPARQSTTATLSGYMDRGFIRAVATVDGTSTISTTEEAAFFNHVAESGIIGRKVSAWSEVAEQATLAERDLLRPYQRPLGRFALAMHRHDFGEDIRDAIALQLERRFQLWALGKSGDPSDKVTVREMDAVDSQAKDMLRTYAFTDTEQVFF